MPISERFIIHVPSSEKPEHNYRILVMHTLEIFCNYRHLTDLIGNTTNDLRKVHNKTIDAILSFQYVVEGMNSHGYRSILITLDENRDTNYDLINSVESIGLNSGDSCPINSVFAVHVTPLFTDMSTDILMKKLFNEYRPNYSKDLTKEIQEKIQPANIVEMQENSARIIRIREDLEVALNEFTSTMSELLPRLAEISKKPIGRTAE